MNVPAIAQQDEHHAVPSGAPLLPIEGNLVAAVRALEAAKLQCEHGLFLLQFAPRNGGPAILKPVAGLQPVVSFADVTALRTRVNHAMKEARRAGSSQAL